MIRKAVYTVPLTHPIKGMWGSFIERVLLTIMTFGIRISSMSLAESLES